jgi:hypothetical protein
MKFDKAKDELVLESGRRVYAFGGVLGINVNGEPMHPTYGWDGYLHEQLSGEFTAEERLEIAHWMIDRWDLWADKGS